MTPIDDEIDRLLTQRELLPPEGFGAAVMSQVNAETVCTGKSKFPPNFLQWFALGAGGIFGMMQSVYFLFGIWFTTAVG